VSLARCDGVACSVLAAASVRWVGLCIVEYVILPSSMETKISPSSSVRSTFSPCFCHRLIVFSSGRPYSFSPTEMTASAGGIPAEAMHANKSQNNRTRTMDGFRAGKLRALAAFPANLRKSKSGTAAYLLVKTLKDQAAKLTYSLITELYRHERRTRRRRACPQNFAAACSAQR